MGWSDTGASPTNCNGTQQPQATVVTGAWTRIFCTFTTGSTSGSPYVFFGQTDATIRTFYIDGAQLELTTGIGAATAYRESNIGLNGTINTPVNLQNAANSSTAFNVQNATGQNMLTVDTVNNQVIIGQVPSNASQAASARLLFGDNCSETQSCVYMGEYNNSTPDSDIMELHGAAGFNFTTGYTADNPPTTYPATVFGLSSTGQALFENSADSSTAVVIQNTAGTAFFAADSTKDIINTNDLNVGAASSINNTTGARLFSDSFESGDASAWSSTGGSGAVASVVNTTARNGKYAFEASTTNTHGAYAQTSITSSSTVYARTYFNSTTIGNPTNLLDLGTAVLGSGTHMRITIGAGGDICWTAFTGIGASCTATAPSASTWHKLEVELVINNGAGVFQIWLDNTNIKNSTALSTGATNIANFAIGNTDATTTKTTVTYYDDVAVDTVPTGDSSSLYIADTLHVAGTSSYGGNLTIGGTQLQFNPGASDTLNIGQATSGAGNQLTIAGGAAASSGGNNGGNLVLNGGAGNGAGAAGLVLINTPTYLTASGANSDASCYTGGAIVHTSCTITATSVNNYSAILIGFDQSGQSATLPDPTITTAGRTVYVTAANGSSDFTLVANSGGGAGIEQDIAMRQNTTATMIWNGSDWTAAGASSSTTLQAAYDNTLTSAGGAELIVSQSTNHDGLTIRNSAAAPVTGNLLEVQSATAANLFSINGSVTDYANNGGSESTYGSEWSSFGLGAGIARNTNATYISNGTGSAGITTSGSHANTGGENTLTTTLTANLQYNVSFAAKLTAGSASFTDMEVYYSKAGTVLDTACTNYSTTTVPTSVWAKVNCTFTAPASGETATNALVIAQTAAANRVWYVDNVSVTVAASQNYATDGGVDDNTNFATNWVGIGTSSSRSTTYGQATSDSAQVTTTGANQGVKNKLSINPLKSTLYQVSVYASASSSFGTFTVQYTPDGSTFKTCSDYNTQTIASPQTAFTQITCYIQTDNTNVTAPYVWFTQTDGTGRTINVDTFSMTIAANTVPNVQIGSGTSGGPLTLLTLDSSASAPIAANNQSLLGSMYYDTTLGKLECYQANGWGPCGASPDNIITISPEYTNAVMHGPSGGTAGVGTMTSDFCSGSSELNINTSICSSTETRNFYRWTSPQATGQTYAVYVTYQLPSTFKSFDSGTTSIAGLTDSTNSTVAYKVYDAKSSALTTCGTVSVSTGVKASWQPGLATGTADPSTCGFSAGDSILFEIDVTASNNSNAYVGTINFSFSNQ